jgi:hypothetical protein
MELNPEHPVTKEMHDLWHKMVGLLLWKFCGGSYTVTPADVEAFGKQMEGSVVIAHAHRETFELKIVPEAEGMRLMAEHEGKGGGIL